MAGHKSVDHDPKRPDVYRERVGLAIKNLRRNVTLCSAEYRARLPSFQLFGIAKISYYWDALFACVAHKNVLRLYISVHYSFVVYILQTLCNLSGQLFHPLFIECLEFAFFHIHLKVTTRNEFSHNINDVVKFEGFKALNYCWVSALIESDSFKLELGTARFFKFLLVNDLDRHFSPCDFVPGSHDGA